MPLRYIKRAWTCPISFQEDYTQHQSAHPSSSSSQSCKWIQRCQDSAFLQCVRCSWQSCFKNRWCSINKSIGTWSRKYLKKYNMPHVKKHQLASRSCGKASWSPCTWRLLRPLVPGTTFAWEESWINHSGILQVSTVHSYELYDKCTHEP